MRWLRLCIALILASTQMIVAMHVVPGTTVMAHLLMTAFVVGGPCLVALVVVQPARLSGALRAVFLGSAAEGQATTHVLELLGGLVVAFGAIGALGSVGAFFATMPYCDALDRTAVRGAVVAAIMPLAFALIVRLALIEPVVWSLRRRSVAEGTAGVAASGSGAGWKVALIVAVTAVAVEGLRAVVLDYLAPATPAHDTSVEVVGMDPAPRDRGARDERLTARIEIRRTDGVTRFRIDGQSLGARLGRRDEIEDLVRHRRSVEIDVAPTVPVKDLVTVIDSCLRARIANAGDPNASSAPWFRIRLLAKKPPAVPQCLRLVRRDWDDWSFERQRKLMILQLPASETSELVPLWEDDPPAINVRLDGGPGRTVVYAGRTRLDPAMLKTWIRPIVESRVDSKTGASTVPILIRCDQEVPCRSLLEILDLLGDEEVRVRDVLLEVAPRGR
jgi:hypothetical protein